MIRRLRLLKRVVTDGHDNCIVDWKTASAKWPPARHRPATSGHSLLRLAFGGSTVIKRRHTSRIELTELVDVAMTELENEFLILETVCEDLKVIYLKARSRIVRAAELGAINSSDIVPVFKEFKNPRHEEFVEPTRYSLLNAFTETIKKYTPGRVDTSYRQLTSCFGLDGHRPALWS